MPEDTFESQSRSPRVILPLLAALCAIAYLPALKNGFISDDFVILDRAVSGIPALSYVLRLSPDRFRITSYLAFGLLKGTFGYHAAGFYAFAILIHFMNSVLVWRLAGLLSRSARGALLASILFAVGQSPQEAVMWLAGMNEALMTLFLLLTALLWLRRKYLWSTVTCVAALFSKESAVVILMLLPLIEFAKGDRLSLRRYLIHIGIPAGLTLILFASSLPFNSLVGGGYYAAGPRAVLVWLNSVHRLLFPWFYLSVVLWFASRTGQSRFPDMSGIIWMAVALLPYVFLTYQNHVPSRHTYLASVGFSWALASLLDVVDRGRLWIAFVASFILINIGYLWMVKERQYRQRAAPTSCLLEELRSRRPGKMLITDFPLNPWIARTAARLVPGWAPEMIRVNEAAASCPECSKLRWDSRTQKYVPN